MSLDHTPAAAALPQIADQPFEVHGLVVRRDDEGEPIANVAHVVHHSPTGIEWGYHGSGPADLALSAMAAMMPVHDRDQGGQAVKVRRGGACVSRAAWDLHQPFKSEFVAAMPPEGATVALEVMRAWVERHLPSYATACDAHLGGDD